MRGGAREVNYKKSKYLTQKMKHILMIWMPNTGAKYYDYLAIITYAALIYHGYYLAKHICKI